MREPTAAVAPVSEIISGTKSAARSLSRTETACKSRARSSGAVAAHLGNASRAARAASSA